MAYEVVFTPPTPSHFATLRSLVGWRNPAVKTLASSIDSSLFWACIYDNNQLVATGRVVGDGAMYFYIQDVIVHPEYQCQKLGTRVMEHIESYVQEYCPKGATVGLLVAKGKEAFYQKYGYLVRDGQGLGHGMCRFI